MAEKTLYPIGDTFIEEDEPGQKAGVQQFLDVAPYSGYRAYSLLFFDLSSFTPGTVINSAKLYLYYYHRVSSAGIGKTHKLRRILQDWTENNTTWSTRPSFADEVSASKVIPSSYGWLSWDVKNDLEAFIAGTYENKGWILMNEDSGEGDPQDVQYRSREYLSLKPYLLVDYTPIPPIQLNLSDQLAIQGAVTDSWKYKGIGKKLTDSFSILDKPGFKLNDKILIFLRDQVAVTDKVISKFPVTETDDFGPSNDAFINQDSTATNYGSQTYLKLVDAEDSERHCLLNFDISGIPSSATNVTAKLYLYFYGDMQLWGENLDQDVFRITESWTEGAVTWTNQPAIAGARTSMTTLIDDQPGWYSWDVGADVIAFLAETYTNYGWLIKPNVLSGNLDQNAYSKETAQSQKPYLEVSYKTSDKWYRAIYDHLLINDILTKADTQSQYHRGFGDNFSPISDSLSIRRIPRSLLTDFDLSPAQIVRQEFPVSDIIPEDEILTVFIETADGQKWKHKLNPL